ncbi:SPOR domain-containing protein [Hydrogenophaga sp. NH-16]|uniref:SPOR domain-containing protein n=1 Tax=Hydrogenophaga sp. NH-16 TaxID=2184519 RepID=UPI000FD8306C|nr:SPOR domain-containing protein [Hydrogenophaga sp. NH-16]
MDAGQDDPTGLPASAASLYRAALGPAGASAYLPVIARFEERGRSAMDWSTRAALGQLAWLVYWRLWGAALAQVGLTLVAAAALGWMWTRAGGVPTGIRIGLTASALVLWCALPGLWGMACLHRGLRERVAAAVEQADSFQEAVERLERSEYGWRVAGLVAAAAVLVVVALLAGVVGQQWRPAAVGAAQVQSPAPPQLAPRLLPSPPVASPTEAPPATPAVLPVQAPVEPVAAAPTPAAPEPVLRPRPRGFGVNVGMFAREANAERAKARLVEAGLPVLHDPIESARGPLTRVRVGPFERREEAEQAATKVRALGLEARVYAP